MRWQRYREARASYLSACELQVAIAERQADQRGQQQRQAAMESSKIKLLPSQPQLRQLGVEQMLAQQTAGGGAAAMAGGQGTAPEPPVAAAQLLAQQPPP